jgi:GNAT superfamily N-acetyltransferase
MLIGLLDSVPVTGGAFRRFGVVDGTETAELKRIWTDSRYRRRGYGRILLAELEARIASLGYRRVYLTTGDRQPEAATPPPLRERACRHTDTPQAPCTIRTLTRPERSADGHQSG